MDKVTKPLLPLLTGVNFNGHNSLRIGPAFQNQPSIDLDAAERYAPEIQFVERAFE